MSKLSGIYDSISRGVSQQVPAARLAGQHSAQVNLHTDPVTGLSRRHGTEFAGEMLLNTLAKVPNSGSTRDTLRAFRTIDYNLTGKEYAVLYPTRAVTSDPLYPQAQNLLARPLFVYSKAGSFSPVVYSSSAVQVRLSQGVAAACQVGRYLLMAPTQATAQGAPTDAWAGGLNPHRAVVWVRGGAYARTFRVTVNLDGTPYVVTHTTPTASYPGVLDTTDIPYGDVEYTKKVNDRVNAYNSAVTSWIGVAGAGVQPPAIATALANALNAETGGQGIFLAQGARILINYSGLGEIAVEDGGDSTLMRVVHQTVKSADLLSDYHYEGKVVQVQADSGGPAYYVKATVIPKSGGFGSVRWEETARVAMPPATFPFLIGTMGVTGTFYLADSPAAMRLLLPELQGVLPDLDVRHVGDAETSPTPHWWGRPVSYLGTFQDRLVVGSGAVVAMSETSSYFNFFRKSSLTVTDTDPVEVYALGAEDDTIRHSVIFDKSLLLFGDKQQYSIDGRIPVTPATTTVIQSSAVSNTTACAPVAVGDFVFFAKSREGSVKLYQITIGDITDTSNASDVSLQLSDYLPGTPVELLAMTSPNVVIVRCSGAPRTLFVFRYIDRGRERILDSWSRFDYGEEFGEIMGMTLAEDKLLLLVHREAITTGGVQWLGRSGGYGWVAAEVQSMLSTVSPRPYLDSLRSWASFTAGDGNRSWWNQPWLTAAVAKRSPYWLQGHTPAPDALLALTADFPIASTDLEVGLEFPSYVTLTSPFRKDSEDNVIPGRLAVGKVSVSYKDTGGFGAHVATPYCVKTSLKFNGRLVGALDNLAGVAPVSTGTLPCFIGRASTDYELTLRAIGWAPFTITSLDWTGQWFYNAQRA